ncbi:MAG: DUF3883 domain-containing protein [Pirellulales bacterium]|nr:DUF3883 domain-containing protein [Alphaproteobacteria bacterium]MDA8041522.1 DUF3883 domain-containing protein [Pirellulales bacterium]
MKKHENYDLLNLLGYGLAKFDMDFVKFFGFETKTDFYERIVQMGVAETVGTVKNRQDLFDPFFDNGRKGWWQKGDMYVHRKMHIDSLFKNAGAEEFAKVVNFHLQERFGAPVRDAAAKEAEKVSPLTKTKFKQLQITGQEAELFFMNNYEKCDPFAKGVLEDARMFGDGYDFQVAVRRQFFLAEVKGVRANAGSIRMTRKEYETAAEHKNAYALVVVVNLDEDPRMSVVFDPTAKIKFTARTTTSKQTDYRTGQLDWR